VNYLARRAALGADQIGTKNMGVIFLKDILEKKYEIEHYKRELVVLAKKLGFIRREIALTEKIIKMIEKEEVIEINRAKS
jgi:hypothetical protein